MRVRYISEVKEPWDRIGAVGEEREFDDERIAHRLIADGYCVPIDPAEPTHVAPAEGEKTKERNRSHARSQ